MNPRDQRVILFKGDVQYGVTNRFIEDMEAAYEEDGQSCVTYDLKEDFDTLKHKLIDEFSQAKPLLALGFNAMGQFYVNDKSVYDMVAFPHISWLVDHPVHHILRLELPVDPEFRQAHVPDNFGLIATIDRGHKQFIDTSLAQKYGCFFLPHGGCKARKESEQPRDLNIVFCGTGTSPDALRNTWKELDAEELKLLEIGVEMDGAEENLPTLELVAKLFTEQEQKPNRKLFMRIMQNVERYGRARERLQTLNILDDAGVKVEVFGKGWGFANFKNHNVHKELDFEEALEIFQRSKMSLNASSFFTDGAHERIFSSMLNGAIPLTNGSKYLDELEGFSEVVEKYDHSDFLAEGARTALENSKELEEKSAAGREFSENGHTFGHRAIELRDIIFNALQ